MLAHFSQRAGIAQQVGTEQTPIKLITRDPVTSVFPCGTFVLRLGVLHCLERGHGSQSGERVRC